MIKYYIIDLPLLYTNTYLSFIVCIFCINCIYTSLPNLIKYCEMDCTGYTQIIS